MKRSSTKKSSTFKIQAEKNVFRNYLEHISDAQTVQDYPHLHDVLSLIFRLFSELQK